MPCVMQQLLKESQNSIIKNNNKKDGNFSSCIDISVCGLLILDDFDNDVHLQILENIEQLCDLQSIDKPHILGRGENSPSCGHRSYFGRVPISILFTVWTIPQLLYCEKPLVLSLTVT